MLGIVSCFIIGGIHGILLRFQKKEEVLRRFEISLLPILYLFLFLIGFSVGDNPTVMSRLGVLTMEATLLAFSGMFGSLLLAPLAKRIVSFNKILNHSLFLNRRLLVRNPTEVVVNQSHKLKGLLTSFCLLLCFTFGIFMGGVPLGFSLCSVRCTTLIVLYSLMWVAGIATGSDVSAIQMLKKSHPIVLILPLFVILGTLGGTAMASHLFLKISPSQGMGVGAGMGYYSLSCAMISSKVGTSLGVLALLANLIREVVTIGFAPLIVRFFGPFGLLAVGASTTCTTSLPSIMLCAGKRFIFLAIINGIALTILVPALILMIL